MVAIVAIISSIVLVAHWSRFTELSSSHSHTASLDQLCTAHGLVFRDSDGEDGDQGQQQQQVECKRGPQVLVAFKVAVERCPALPVDGSEGQQHAELDHATDEDENVDNGHSEGMNSSSATAGEEQDDFDGRPDDGDASL